MLRFWENERCEYCNAEIVQRIVELQRKVGKKYVLIKNVPAGVCKGCGTRYYTANVLKMVDALIRDRRKAKARIPMIVYSL
jgi:YgiT-type zinc finger domain-containing protein